MEASQNTNTELPEDPSGPLLVTKDSNLLQGWLYIMFNAALFTTAKNWNQARCPCTGVCVCVYMILFRHKNNCENG